MSRKYLKIFLVFVIFSLIYIFISDIIRFLYHSMEVKGTTDDISLTLSRYKLNALPKIRLTGNFTYVYLERSSYIEECVFIGYVDNDSFSLLKQKIPYSAEYENALYLNNSFSEISSEILKDYGVKLHDRSTLIIDNGTCLPSKVFAWEINEERILGRIVVINSNLLMCGWLSRTTR